MSPPTIGHQAIVGSVCRRRSPRCSPARRSHATGRSAVPPAAAGQRAAPPSSSPPSAASRTSRTCRSRCRTLSGEKLDVLNSGGNDVRFLSGRVPSLNIESSFGRAFPRFYIRGLGNTDFDLNASQPVSLVYDDVVQENPILKGFPVFDLERVEVLRGPQGTLFGRNTPAGVVKFESVTPVAGARRLRQARLRHATTWSTSKAPSTCRSARTGRRASRRCSSAATTGSTTPSRRPERRASKATTSPPRACSCCTTASDFERAAQRARAPPQRHRAPVPRQHHQAGHQRPGRRLRRGQGLASTASTIPELDSRGASARLTLGPRRRLHAVLDHRLRDASRPTAAATSTAASAPCSRRRPARA